MSERAKSVELLRPNTVVGMERTIESANMVLIREVRFIMASFPVKYLYSDPSSLMLDRRFKALRVYRSLESLFCLISAD